MPKFCKNWVEKESLADTSLRFTDVLIAQKCQFKSDKVFNTLYVNFDEIFQLKKAILMKPFEKKILII